MNYISNYIWTLFSLWFLEIWQYYKDYKPVKRASEISHMLRLHSAHKHSINMYLHSPAPTVQRAKKPSCHKACFMCRQNRQLSYNFMNSEYFLYWKDSLILPKVPENTSQVIPYFNDSFWILMPLIVMQIS